MAEVYDSVSVHCPYERIPDYLIAYFRRLGAVNGAHATLALKVPVADLAVEREVIATVSPRPGHRRYEALNLTWTPKDGGPYPSFTGGVSIRRQDRTSATLELAGTYEPPYGVVGHAFDATLGRRIAATAVRTLLATLKRELEAAYRSDAEAVEAATLPHYPTTYE
jgi:hypothetical protein